MGAELAELVGVFVIVVGCACLVGAAALVATALAVAVAGGLLILAGVLTVYVAARLDQRSKTARAAVR